MIASRARPPLTLATILLGASLLLRPSPPTAPAPKPGLVEIHVKLRAQGMQLAAAATYGMRVEAMFDAVADEPDDLARWIVVTAAGDPSDALAELAADPAVEEAFVAPEISLPTAAAATVIEDESCPVTTPSFESYQGYLGAAPHGIDAPAAWRIGARGAGIWFADVEGGWNAKHEDLPGARLTHVGGRPIDDPSWYAHGTAVLGEVAGVDNHKGVVGIAPDLDRIFTSSIGGTNVARAIDRAGRALRPGDVLLIELQGGGPRGRYLPVEFWTDVFDVIRATSKRGVIVIEAAGNGGEDLDHPDYNGKFDRTKRDSGAIMIGAGGPAREGYTDRARLDFSNYGARVDVQGWGRKVATLEYGDLQRCSDERHRHYTGEFSGTSSASPIVAGAAVILEGIAKQRRGVLSPAALRALLVATGSPQTGDTSEHIGPRPDLARAIEKLGGR